MAINHLLLILLVATFLQAAWGNPGNSTVDARTATAYDVLERYNLPRGLLPMGVKSYVLEEGCFQVTLSVPLVCDMFVTIDGEKCKIRYGSMDSGIIRSGSITGLDGVRMFVMGMWRGFSEVNRVGDQLEILVAGETPRSYPVSAFAHSPRCT